MTLITVIATLSRKDLVPTLTTMNLIIELIAVMAKMALMAPMAIMTVMAVMAIMAVMAVMSIIAFLITLTCLKGLESWPRRWLALCEWVSKWVRDDVQIHFIISNLLEIMKAL